MKNFNKGFAPTPERELFKSSAGSADSRLVSGFALTEMIVVLTVLTVVGAVSVGYFQAVKIRQSKQAFRPMPVRSVQRTVTVKLEPQNGSGRYGIAVLAEINGKVKVVMNLSGPSGVTRPAHIHVGSCPDVGAVKYPLTSLVAGVSQTDLGVSLDELMAQLPLAINVHKSADEPSVYLACGDIKLTPGMMNDGNVIYYNYGPNGGLPGQGMMGY